MASYNLNEILKKRAAQKTHEAKKEMDLGDTARVKVLSPMRQVMKRFMRNRLAIFGTVTLAIINLLPLPVLDGGHVVFALWRGIFRRELPPRVLNTLVNVFAIAIILLFLYLCFHDVWSMAKLFGK